jgi:hypothetical protein
VELYGHGGVEGAGLGAGIGLADAIAGAPDWIGLRADLNATPTIHHRFSAGGLDYDGAIRLRSADLYVDVFPFHASGGALSAFRLTAGALVNDDRVDGDASFENGSATYHGRPIAIPGPVAHGSVRYPAVMPYLGIGFGHKPSTRGWSVFGDAGVVYGNPRASLGADLSQVPAFAQPWAQSELDSERAELQREANRYRFLPIVKVGVSYRF